MGCAWVIVTPMRFPTLSRLVRSILSEASPPTSLRPYPGGAMRYDEERAEEEAGEYFENEAALRALGRDAWEDVGSLAGDILSSPVSPIAEDEIASLQNTDADSVLRGEWESVRGEMARERDVASVEALLSSGRPVRPPIVCSYPGGMWLLGGNTRLCVGVSMGYLLPVVRLSVRG
jgi:hypothetical protein